MDITAFFALQYGLSIISSATDAERAGCVVNTFSQVTASPLQISVALNKENHTTQIVQESGRLCAVSLAQDVPLELIGTFGFHSSTDIDKFDEWSSGCDKAGIPFITEYTVARFSATVVDTLDLGSHLLFIGKVTEAEVTSSAEPMTYAYYHQVKGGKTPPKASTFIAEELPLAALDDAATFSQKRVGWRCSVCGYVEWIDELPEDFMCPVCGVGKDKFERIEE
ncbi:MAG: flavin reductase [Raoultibacter sp.]